MDLPEAHMSEGYSKETIDAKLEAMEARMDARVERLASSVELLVTKLDERTKHTDYQFEALGKRIDDALVGSANRMNWGLALLAILVTVLTFGVERCSPRPEQPSVPAIIQVPSQVRPEPAPKPTASPATTAPGSRG